MVTSFVCMGFMGVSNWYFHHSERVFVVVGFRRTFVLRTGV
jgi:hypothetical protein